MGACLHTWESMYSTCAHVQNVCSQEWEGPEASGGLATPSSATLVHCFFMCVV